MAATGTPSIPTPLTAAHPSTATLSRNDIESLLGETSNPTDPSQLQRDQAYFEAFFHSLPQVRQLYHQHAQLLRQNEDKARQNTALQQPLEALRAETQQLFDRATALQAQWPQLEAEMNELYKRFSPSSLHFHLAQSATKLNDRSEQLANAYVEGLPYPVGDDASSANQSVEQVLDDVTFVRRYKAQRMLYHRRKLIAERSSKGDVHWTD
ncbi:uncharacterized protein PFL1_04184 [Pseudozyma flocculosa PF-1]|uniref:VPS37 C-terminal domain-containing protein n=2 Tax=Pseudozyma flocculosa TaxID=84751 RepID=A0A5C3EUH2_9BASI|nr:uncharacterized protein PFL1_04184 [Pseudozyma flocculosa PF-1]EPQ28357.1 hypothetical protein PFL1_04184 [Pseudozyma flocculosa PF-1]SPO35510.1 uncharacterized protein PSFLO_00981 [Pseudozyma flocculosa]